MLAELLIMVIFLKSNLCQNIHKELTISQIDLLGFITKFASVIFTAIFRPVEDYNKQLCNVFTLGLAGSEFKISLRPHGNCSYCCPLINPAEHIKLYLCSKPNNTTKLHMIRKKGYLKQNGINSNATTVIYIHGFTEHGAGVSATEMRDAYFARNESFNVMLLDWTNLGVLPWYTVAVNNTRVVGKLLGKFLKFYNLTGELPLDNVHLVGFSLGSHIAGFAGKVLGPKQIPRITGLDPAFPQFSLSDTTQRLTKSDAKYVDVIHTDGGIFGFPISIGHSDFYPNGGRYTQPGCSTSQLAEEKNIFAVVLCNHFHAWRFYAESVMNPTAFPATKCGILRNGILRKCGFTLHGYMGFMANKSTSGNF